MAGEEVVVGQVQELKDSRNSLSILGRPFFCPPSTHFNLHKLRHKISTIIYYVTAGGGGGGVARKSEFSAERMSRKRFKRKQAWVIIQISFSHFVENC